MTTENAIIPSSAVSGAIVPVGSEQPPGQPEINPLLRLHMLLRGRYKFAIPLALIFGVAGGIAGWKSAKPIWRGQSSLMLRATVPSADPTATGAIMPMFEAFVQSQVQMIRSQRCMMLAMENPDWQRLAPGTGDKQLLAFAESLDVLHRPNTENVDIAFDADTPEQALIGVQSVTDAYAQLYKEFDTRTGSERQRALEDQRTTLSNQLQGINDSIAAVAGDLGPQAVNERYTARLQDLSTLETQLSRAKLQLQLLDQAPTTAPASQPSVDAIETMAANSPAVRDLLVKARQAELSVEMLRGHVGENNPAMRAAIEQKTIVDAQLADAVRQYRAAAGDAATAAPGDPVAMDRDHLKSQISSLSALYERTRNELTDLARKQLQIQKLQADAANVSQDLDRVRTSLKNLNAQAMFGSRLEIQSRGERPLRPVKDSRKSRAGAFGFAGVMLGFGLFAAWGLFDQRFRTIADARVGLSNATRLLGILPTLPDDLADPEQASLAAYCVHHIRTLLQIGIPSGEHRVFGITSPSPGDGKTSLCIALGLSFAGAGARTLLIDCDMVGGGLTRRMNSIIRRKIGQILRRSGMLTDQQISDALRIAQDTNTRLGEVLVRLGYLTQADVDHALAVQRETLVGLLEVLNGESLDEAITGTGTENLFILPLGSAEAHDSAQLSPLAVRRIIEAASKHFDVILIDSGPILGSIEASTVAATVNEVVLAVSRGQHRPLVDRSIAHLNSIHAAVAGVVFNRALADDIEQSYGSQYSVRSGPRVPISEEQAASQDGAGNGRLGPVPAAIFSGAANGAAQAGGSAEKRGQG